MSAMPLPPHMPGALRQPQLPDGGQPPLPLLQQPYDPVVNRVQNRAISSRDERPFSLLETHHPPKERTLDQVVGQVADHVARNQLTSYEMYRLTPVEDEKAGDEKDQSTGKRIRALGKKKTWVRVLVVQQFIPQDAIASAIQELDEDGQTVAEKMKELGTNQQVQISTVLNENIQRKVNREFVWQIAQLGLRWERRWGRRSMSCVELYLKHTPRPDVECVGIVRQREQAKIQQARQSMPMPPHMARPGVSFGPSQIQGMGRGTGVPPAGIRVVQYSSCSNSNDSSDSSDSASTAPSINTRPSTVSTGQSRSRSIRSRSTKSDSRGHDRSRSRERRSRDSMPPPRARVYVVDSRREKDRNSGPRRRRSSSPYPSRLPAWAEKHAIYDEHGRLRDRSSRQHNRSDRTDLPWADFNRRRDPYEYVPSLSGSTLRGSTVPSSSMSGSTRTRTDNYYQPSRSSRESRDERRRRFEEEDRREMIDRMAADVLELHRQRVRAVQRPAPSEEFTRRVHIRDMDGRVPQDYFGDIPGFNRPDPDESDTEDDLYYRRDEPDHFRRRREHYRSRSEDENQYDFIGRDEANPFRRAARDEPSQFRPQRELHKTRLADDYEFDFIGRPEVNPLRPLLSSRQSDPPARSEAPKSILKVSKQLEPKVRPSSSSPNHTQLSPPPPEFSARDGLSSRERLSLPAIMAVNSQERSQLSLDEPTAAPQTRSSASTSTPGNSCREIVLYKPLSKPKRQKQRARFEDVAEKRPRRVSFQTKDQSGVHMWTRTPTVRTTSRSHIIIHNSAPPAPQRRKPDTTMSKSAALASGREETTYSPSGLKRRSATWTTPPHDVHPTPSWPLNSITVGGLTNSSDTSLRYRPTPTFSSQPSTREPCYCQTDGSDGSDGIPPHQNSNPAPHSKAIGYCFTLCLFLFLIIGIFAACVQAIAVFLLLEEQASSDHKTPTWRDNDYFQMLSGSCWQILGMAFTLLITLKHTSEHNDHRSWYFPWFVGFICVLSSAFAMGLYVRSPAWSLATSGFSSLAQVSMHFLTIRILEKNEIREKRTLQWQIRGKVDEDLEQHKVKCRIRKAERDHEMLSYERSLEARRSAVLRDVERMELNSRLTRQRLADEEAERRKKVMDEIVQLERQKAMLELDLQRGRRLRPPGSDSGYGSASISGASVTDDARSTGGDSSDDRCEMRGGTTPDMVGEETFEAGIRVYAVNV